MRATTAIVPRSGSSGRKERRVIHKGRGQVYSIQSCSYDIDVGQGVVMGDDAQRRGRSAGPKRHRGVGEAGGGEDVGAPRRSRQGVEPEAGPDRPGI